MGDFFVGFECQAPWDEAPPGTTWGPGRFQGEYQLVLTEPGQTEWPWAPDVRSRGAAAAMAAMPDVRSRGGLTSGGADPDKPPRARQRLAFDKGPRPLPSLNKS